MGDIRFAAPSAQPIGYQHLLSDLMRPLPSPDSTNLVFEGLYPAIDTDTYTAWEKFQAMYLHSAMRGGRNEVLPARIELVGDNVRRRQGLILFREDGQAIVHVTNALIGYDGSGPTLTYRILQRLGVSMRDFDAIQKEVKASRAPYKVVISRENPDGAWMYWFVS